MQVISVAEAQQNLAEIISQLGPAQELLITQDNRPVARLIGASSPPPRKPRQPGTALGKLVILKEDDDHLQDFAEYMP
jgi:prevent-host-death family protein